ncbi:hypothetical protein DXB61_11390 [Parabacteroides merdae]|uniref:Uncharacterized protein n=1 Tax=Parabacteroides merdae TaxID=46503 RepID=A0AB37LSC9_9BACT|nr:hypothetical protein DXB61_11390 [Parabacteroides merdae]
MDFNVYNVLRNNHIAFLVSIAYTVSQEHIFRKPKDSTVFLHYMHLPRFIIFRTKQIFNLSLIIIDKSHRIRDTGIAILYLKNN